MLINVKMPTIVGILTFMSMINFIFSCVEHEKGFSSKNGDRSFYLYAISTNISRGTKVEKTLTLAPERYTAGFCMVAKVIQWCI